MCVVWLVLCDGKIYGVLGLSEIEHCVLRWQNLEQNGKRGCAQISAHPCESVASTLDSHNFLVRTTIHAFLDSKKISLSLELNKIKCSAKM